MASVAISNTAHSDGVIPRNILRTTQNAAYVAVRSTATLAGKAVTEMFYIEVEN